MSDQAEEVLEVIPACIHCGCTDDAACEDGCVWVCQDPRICSSCLHMTELTTEDLQRLGQDMVSLATQAQDAADDLLEAQEQNQLLVNMLTVIVNREGGSARLSKPEFDSIHGLRLESKADPEAEAVVLSVHRIDPTTGERVSSLILPGRLPIIGL